MLLSTASPLRKNVLRRYRLLLAAVAVAAIITPYRPSAAAAMPQEGSPELVLVGAPASYLGVNIADIDQNAARALELKSTSGVEVTAVDRDAPAGKAGIHLRDVILAVNGRPVTSARQFREILRGYAAGREVLLAVIRKGRPIRFTIKLADREKQEQAYIERYRPPMPAIGESFTGVVSRHGGFPVSGGEVASDPSSDDPDGNQPQAFGFFGIGAELDAIGPQLASYFGVKDGTGMLVKSVEPGSPAAVAGLQAGDVVLKLNDEPLIGPLDCLRGIELSRGKPIQLTIVRNRRTETLTLPPLPHTQALLEWPLPCIAGRCNSQRA